MKCAFAAYAHRVWSMQQGLRTAQPIQLNMLLLYPDDQHCPVYTIGKRGKDSDFKLPLQVAAGPMHA